MLRGPASRQLAGACKTTRAVHKSNARAPPWPLAEFRAAAVDDHLE